MALTTLSKRFLATWASITYWRHGSLSVNGSTFVAESARPTCPSRRCGDADTPRPESDGRGREDREAGQDRDGRAATEQPDAERRCGGLDHLRGEETVTERGAGMVHSEVRDDGGEHLVDAGWIGGVVVGSRGGLGDGSQRHDVGAASVRDGEHPNRA